MWSAKGYCTTDQSSQAPECKVFMLLYYVLLSEACSFKSLIYGLIYGDLYYMKMMCEYARSSQRDILKNSRF